MAGRNRLFVRRRDGRIEIRLNDAGRSVARDAFGHVVAAEREVEHDWHTSLSAPIDPSTDHDDPTAMLTRQLEIATNAELALMTVDEAYLTDAEAWVWLTTLQVALRATALSTGVLDEERLETASDEITDRIRILQQFLFELAELF